MSTARRCYDCAHSNEGGHERGYAKPCGGCTRPEMSNFVPISGLLKQKPVLTEDALAMMQNLHADRWWCTGIVEQGWYHTSDGHEAMGRARATKDYLIAAGAAFEDSGKLRLHQLGVYWLTGKRPPEPWTPIRSGEVYCSPACGFRCTWAAYREARLLATKLAKALSAACGPVVFEARVWENMGWHWSAVAKSVHGEVSPSKNADGTVARYWARIEGGSQWNAYGPTAAAAWSGAVAACKATADENARTLAKVGAR